MKGKQLVVTVVGGILGIGAAVISYSEIQRLKDIVSTKNDCIAKQEKVIESYKKVIAAKDAVIEKDREYIDALEQLNEKNKEMIERQATRIAEIQTRQMMSEQLKGANNPSTNLEVRSSEHASNQVQRKGPEYVFQYDLDLNVVAKYDSVTAACSSVGLKSETSITRVMKGKADSAGGFFWSRGVRPLKKFPEKWIELSQKKNKKQNS